MTTQTPGTTAREYALEMVHFIRKKITFSNYGSVITVGTVPGGSVINGGGVQIQTAFNSSGTDLLDVGTLADDDGLATDLTLAAVGFLALDELAATTNLYLTADTVITCTPAQSVADATAGIAHVIVTFIPNIDLQD